MEDLIQPRRCKEDFLVLTLCAASDMADESGWVSMTYEADGDEEADLYRKAMPVRANL